MATLIQGYLDVSDAEVVELVVVDLRVQMVLDCLGAEKPTLSQGALCASASDWSERTWTAVCCNERSSSRATSAASTAPPLQAARERLLVLRLDEQMHMRPLQADVNDPDPLADRREDRGLVHGLVHVAPAQAPDLGYDPEDHVQRICGLDLRPCHMR